MAVDSLKAMRVPGDAEPEPECLVGAPVTSGKLKEQQRVHVARQVVNCHNNITDRNDTKRSFHMHHRTYK